MRGSATTKVRHVILDFDMLSRIITFEQKGRFEKETHKLIFRKLNKVFEILGNLNFYLL